VRGFRGLGVRVNPRFRASRYISMDVICMHIYGRGNARLEVAAQIDTLEGSNSRNLWGEMGVITYICISVGLGIFIDVICIHICKRETGRTHKRPNEEPPPLHFTTIEGGAAKVRTTSHTPVGGRAEDSVGGRVNIYVGGEMQGLKSPLNLTLFR